MEKPESVKIIHFVINENGYFMGLGDDGLIYMYYLSEKKWKVWG